jgi:hypothetical protein
MCSPKATGEAEVARCEDAAKIVVFISNKQNARLIADPKLSR